MVLDIFVLPAEMTNLPVLAASNLEVRPDHKRFQTFAIGIISFNSWITSIFKTKEA